jgi:hypothetical protein
MSARRVFDIDSIMRDVRLAANLCPAATTATLLQIHPNRSDVAIVAGDHAAEIEERAGLASDLVPLVYLDAWARLNHQKPSSVSETEWCRALDEGGQFLDRWGYVAHAFGWTPGEIFDVSAGLVWRLSGEPVEFIGSSPPAARRTKSARRNAATVALTFQSITAFSRRTQIAAVRRPRV